MTRPAAHRLVPVAAAAALASGLAACGPGENDPGPGGVTVEEARALDDAASMLEERRLPPDALETPPPASPSDASPPAATPAPSPQQ